MQNNQPKILLTIYLGGRLATPIARKMSHHQKRRVMSSPFERVNPDGTYETPRGHVKIVIPHEDAKYSECTQKTTLPQETYDHFTNPDILPHFIRGKNALENWQALPELSRLKINLDRFCEGKGYTFELL